jgi:probable F420-dependent oxidoreductase
MKIGVQTFCTDQTMDPREWAVELEERGFDALVFPEHPHVPIMRTTPYPPSYGGGEMPEFYKRPYDPFVACSYAAAATSRLQIGTGICLVAFRDPIVTAKAISSIDRLSGGRFLFGVGFGWNVDEFPSHGQDFRRRHAVVREKVEAMKAIWTTEVAEYKGQYVNFEPSWSWPKPVTQPHPPILVGGNGPVAMRHAVDWGDHWFPTPLADDPTLAKASKALRQLAEDRGRDPMSISISVGAAVPDERVLASMQEVGVEYANLRMYARSPDEQRRDLDQVTRIKDAILGG